MSDWMQYGASEVLQSLTALGVGAVIKYVKGINARLDTLNGSVPQSLPGGLPGGPDLASGPSASADHGL